MTFLSPSEQYFHSFMYLIGQYCCTGTHLLCKQGTDINNKHAIQYFDKIISTYGSWSFPRASRNRVAHFQYNHFTKFRRNLHQLLAYTLQPPQWLKTKHNRTEYGRNMSIYFQEQLHQLHLLVCNQDGVIHPHHKWSEILIRYNFQDMYMKTQQRFASCTPTAPSRCRLWRHTPSLLLSGTTNTLRTEIQGTVLP